MGSGEDTILTIGDLFDGKPAVWIEHLLSQSAQKALELPDKTSQQ